MFIVMHCMGTPFNGETIKEKSLGGSETAAYYVAKELVAKGHNVSLFTNSKNEGVFDGVKYIYAGEPTQVHPMGSRFHHYAENTPHDVLIIQRIPGAFNYNFQSKINLWWVHDLALLRTKNLANSQMWNVDGVLTVSEFHKNQYVDVYGFDPEFIKVVRNGVDLNLFEGPIDFKLPVVDEHSSNQKSLLYTSRPERGLEHLLAPHGIMDRLAEYDRLYHLYLCSYDNVTGPMEAYYKYLNDRASAMENVTLLGHLNKKDLADVMRQCDMLVYPTPGPLQPEFEEVSCITAMEAMAAGLPFLSTNVGALPETCKNYDGAILLNVNESGLPDIDSFVFEIAKAANKTLAKLSENQISMSQNYTWSKSVCDLQNYIKDIDDRKSSTSHAVNLLNNSDIFVLKDYVSNFAETAHVGSFQNYEDTEKSGFGNLKETSIISKIKKSEMPLYDFAFNNKFDEHYLKYYEYEKNRGVDYGPESLDGNSRFEYVSNLVSKLPDRSIVLDYGCAHGHYTINLAKRFPRCEFVGVDLVESNIDKAISWASKDSVTNVTFMLSGEKEIWEDMEFDCVIAAEVLEHVECPEYLANDLNKLLRNKNSKFIITVPYGPWESQGYEVHHPWRAHLHHFSRGDLINLFGGIKGFKIVAAPSGIGSNGRAIGSYIVSFNKSPDEFKLLHTAKSAHDIELKEPVETLSVCLIVKNAAKTIASCLDSVKDVANEIIVSIDKDTSDDTLEVVQRYANSIKGNWPDIRILKGYSALEKGFDRARNLSIENASGDWILWIDSDEVFHDQKNLAKYLRPNQYDGYAIKQHHFSMEPLGVSKTDMPCRLFRNRKGIEFFGVVHEHPEKELNQGVGQVRLLDDVSIAHYGYTDEITRRGRFSRNIELLVRDREKYPERILGRVLWIRDLAQMCKYEMENNGGVVTAHMRERCEEGFKLWEELVNEDNLRLILDGLSFYSFLVEIYGGGFYLTFSVSADKYGQPNENIYKCMALNFSHAEKLLMLTLRGVTHDFKDSKYT